MYLGSHPFGEWQGDHAVVDSFSSLLQYHRIYVERRAILDLGTLKAVPL
jgi:hypothetical protein